MGTKAPKSESQLGEKVSPEGNKSAPRRSSFGLLLRRSKSTELKGKKAELQRQEIARQERPAVPAQPPSLPKLYNGGSLLQDQDPLIRDSVQIMTNQYPNNQQRTASGQQRAPVPIPPIPTVDPYARTESMTHRGRYSYASSAVSSINSPRRVRRRKDPTPFNILIIGSRSSGKTSFLKFLKTSLALTGKKNPTRPDDYSLLQDGRSGNFTSSYIETEIDNERVGLTIWDSVGLERNVVDLQLREMTAFIESKFEETFTEEMKVVRAPGVRDTHIHCAFFLLDPVHLDNNLAVAQGSFLNGASNGKTTPLLRVSGALDEDLDLQVLRALQGKTTVVPVISKADTITTAHMKHLKKNVWEAIKKANLDPLEALGLDDADDDSNPDRLDEEDEDRLEAEGEADIKTSSEEDDVPIQALTAPSSPRSSRSNRLSTGSIRRYKTAAENNGSLAVGAVEETPPLPMSIISPDIYEPSVIGRKFPWGFADPMKEDHCDFVRLKEAVFSEWRGELREASKELWYENWRTSRLKYSQGGKR